VDCLLYLEYSKVDNSPALSHCVNVICCGSNRPNRLQICDLLFFLATKLRQLKLNFVAHCIIKSYVAGVFCPLKLCNLNIFYRAMHVVLARYCYRMSSVRLSVRPSVTLRYRGHIGWISSKLVTRIISLGSSLLGYTAKEN